MGGIAHVELLTRDGRFKAKPKRRMRTQRKEIGLVGNRRKFRAPKQFNRNALLEFGQIQLNRLGESREIGDDQYVLVLPLPDKCQHLAVFRAKEFEGAPAESFKSLAKRKRALHPPEKGIRVLALRLDIDAFVVKFRILNDRQKKCVRMSAREAGIPV